MSNFFSRSWFALLVLGLSAAGLGVVALVKKPGPQIDDQAAVLQRYAEIPFDGKTAFGHLEKICEIGPRPTGSEGMKRQQELIAAHFQALKAKVTRQTFTLRHPLNGQPVEAANLVVEWNESAKERLLLCAHYDTRPFPDRDPVNPRGRFIGANDGASGVALLMELGRHMESLKGRIGVDFVLFDAEELVFDEQRNEYFLGSRYFAQSYRTQPPPYQYRAGVLLDMVGDAQLFIRKEPFSGRYARPVIDDVWAAAIRIGVREFGVQYGQEVRDDHLPLNEIARIPTIDVIDFDYPFWHTENDRPEKCSAVSLEKVGKTIYEWLRTAVNR